ncbi:LOW QUALITY PROTEIN: hypothetical protein V2J09_020761 [Rumex salicifolius]
MEIKFCHNVSISKSSPELIGRKGSKSTKKENRDNKQKLHALGHPTSKRSISSLESYASPSPFFAKPSSQSAQIHPLAVKYTALFFAIVGNISPSLHRHSQASGALSVHLPFTLSLPPFFKTETACDYSYLNYIGRSDSAIYELYSLISTSEKQADFLNLQTSGVSPEEYRRGTRRLLLQRLSSK